MKLHSQKITDLQRALENFMGGGSTLNFYCDSDYMAIHSSKPTEVYT